MVVSAGKRVIADILDQGTYTPVLTAVTTNPTLGSGSVQSGWWKRIDDMIIGGALIRFGTSGAAAGSGNYYISLPFLANTAFLTASDSVGLGSLLGATALRDNSVPAGSGGVCWLAGTADKVSMRHLEATAGVTGSAAPWAWAASDALSINFAYQADPSVL